MDIKPNVFPNQQQMDAIQSEEAKKAAFEAEKAQATNEIYSNSALPSDTPEGHQNAVEAMRMRTQQQLEHKNTVGRVQHPELSERVIQRVEQPTQVQEDPNAELLRKRDEQLRINQENILRYQQQANQASARGNDNIETNSGLYEVNNETNMNQNQQGTQNNFNNNYVPPTPPSVPPTNNFTSYGQNPSNIDPYIYEISQPNYNAPFDVIPLPSQGKMYPSKKPNVKVAYMTTADENILTSPNLLASGEFLEILINRKLLEPSIRYRDLTVGDRNAIMLWLRATGYGEMYPVTIYDENNKPFETDINLQDLKTKNLGAEPDSEGLFDFVLPLSKNQIKFKFLTCGDVDDIERIVEDEREKKLPIDNTTTYTIERIIVDVNGTRDKNYIKDFVSTLRIGDGKALMDYIASIESGIDLNINVTTPGGGSVATFLPLNMRFFWPNS
jgi:hypothetical protein